jgi:prophage maintenance system killer protein
MICFTQPLKVRHFFYWYFYVQQHRHLLEIDAGLKQIGGGDGVTEVAIYRTDQGTIEVKLEKDSVWLTQDQIAELFGRERSVITKHIRNVFKDEEVERDSVCANFAHTATDGKTYAVEHYNLDVIISVGYRVKSRKGVQFRQWATHLLKQHLLQGYTLHRQRFETNARELEAALLLIRKTAESVALSTDSGRGLVEVVTHYTRTFLWLQRYDEGLLVEPSGQMGGIFPTMEEARQSIAILKADLLARDEAGPLFGQERGDGLTSILGNLNQSVFGEPAYPTVEAKAAHLLYFVIKNHPLSDGNKRSGALLFLDFLHRNGRLFRPDGSPVVNDVGLAALALLVAESNPNDKDVLIRLIMNMLASGAEDKA